MKPQRNFTVSLHLLLAEEQALTFRQKKIGQYSVTYHSAADTISSMLNGSDAGMSDLLYSIVGRHLGSTGLLYRGVD